MIWGRSNFANIEQIVVMYSDPTLDYFLIKYCPLKFVQDYIKEVYDEAEYEAIKTGRSKYDTFIRPESGTKIRMIQNSKFHNNKLPKYYNKYLNKKIIFTEIKVYYNNELLLYNKEYDIFLFRDELGTSISNRAVLYNTSLKAIIRKIIKWGLPKGSIVIISGKYKYTQKFVVK